MRIVLIVSCIALGLPTMGHAKGLKDLSPKKDEPKKEDAKPAEPEKPKEISKPEAPADMVKKEEKKKPGISDLGGRFLMGIALGYGKVSGGTGDWSSGFSGGFTAGFEYLKLSDKLRLLGSYSYLPSDVIVKENNGQYRGVVESHLFGSIAQYRLKKDLVASGIGEIGVSSAKLNSINNIPTDAEDPETAGAQVRLGGSVFWKFQDNVWLGGDLSLALGTFSGWSLAVSTQFTL